MQNRVFVLDTNRNPLMPCRPQRARRLLKNGRASVYRRYPFTIIIHDLEGGDTQPVQVKIDPGSKQTGIAVVAAGEVVWGAELEHRAQRVADRMTSRRQLRRGRRHRKTRYRPARFNNRRRPKGWLTPSMHSRVGNVVAWVAKIRSLVPASNISLERVKFDMQVMRDPEIEGEQYQQGTLQGTEVREYLLHKFNHTCIYCGARPAVRGTVEHIVPRSRGGSDRIDNLAWACYECNQKRGNQSLDEFVGPEKAAKIKRQVKAPLKDAAAVNATRNVIAAELDAMGLPVEWGSGGRTAWNRHENGYPKAHWIDAACVGQSGLGVVLDPQMQVLRIKAMGRGSRQMCKMDRFGFPRAKPKAFKRVHGFQTGDMVKAIVLSGKKIGTHVGRVAVRASGSFRVGATDGINWRHCRQLCSADGYEYSTEVNAVGAGSYPSPRLKAGVSRSI